MAELDDGGFWAFSLLVYAQPGVAAGCLALQDQQGADVNMLLFALWAAHRGQCLSETGVAELDRAVEPWRASIVCPLRDVRRALRGVGADRLRDIVTEAERAAERHQQELMEQFLPLGPPRQDPDLADRNLAVYAAFAGLNVPGDVSATLAASTRSVRVSPE